jgi:hypothetical protein
VKTLACTALLLGGCFNPTFNNPACGPNGECPPGTTCVENKCRTTIDDASGGPDDAPLADTPPDAFDPLCYGEGTFYICLAAAPSQSMTLNGNINSTACTASTSSGVVTGSVVVFPSGTSSMACVFAATSVSTTGSPIGAFGDKPILFISSSDIMIAAGAKLDGSSTASGTGPGANSVDCGATPSGAANSGGAGGGAGGTFGSKGGNGGNGGAANGGIAATVSSSVAKLRGGCRGGDGGTGGAGSGTALGGGGGGAFALFARGGIQINGAITVSGAGGAGGREPKGGAGGGGSGGMVLLSASTITLGTSGQIQANGGGGGAGAGSITSGDDGSDAVVVDQAASGGVLTTGGCTPGGAGAYKTVNAVSPANSFNGGPGGGGGVGVIRVLSGQSLPAAKISPPQT